jgi:hypothetical protein
MPLLNSQKPAKINRQPSLTITDGWNFGIGFGLALAIALPIILGAIGCLVWMAALILGISLT